MRWVIGLLGVTFMLAVSGCGAPRIAWQHEPRGGVYDPQLEITGRGAGNTGEYVGYPNYAQDRPW